MDEHYKTLVKTALLIQVLSRPIHYSLKSNKNKNQFSKISQRSAEILVDLYLQYVSSIASGCKLMAESSGRTMISILDFRHLICSDKKQKQLMNSGCVVGSTIGLFGFNSNVKDLEKYLYDFTVSVSSDESDLFNLPRLIDQQNDQDKQVDSGQNDSIREIQPERVEIQYEVLPDFGLKWLPKLPKLISVENVYKSASESQIEQNIEEERQVKQQSDHVRENPLVDKIKSLLVNTKLTLKKLDCVQDEYLASESLNSINHLKDSQQINSSKPTDQTDLSQVIRMRHLIMRQASTQKNVA